MKIKFLWALLAIPCISLLSSCDDDEPKTALVEFEATESDFSESDGTFNSFHPDLTNGETEGREIEVNLSFNRPTEGNIILRFDVGGSAKQFSSSTQRNDFEIMDEGVGITVDDDEITIPKGITEAAFKILLFEDVPFEYDDSFLNEDEVSYETVELTLLSVKSGPAKLGENVQHTLRILEDDAVAILQWEAQDMTPTAANVDMDMYLWAGGEPVWYSADAGTGFEGFSIPAGLVEGDVGMSYTYYSGMSDDLDFATFWFSSAGLLDGERYPYNLQGTGALVFGGNYKLANVNTYSETNPPKIAQTIQKDGIDYVNFSGLSAFTTGSRAGQPLMMKKLSREVLNDIAVRSEKKSLKFQMR